MTATGQFAVVPAAENPFGSFVTRSPWLIQIRWRPSRPANRRERFPFSLSSSSAGPYSRMGEGVTFPPSVCAMS